MELEFIQTAFITMFVAIDPIGLAAIFLSLTSHMNASDRKFTANRAVLIAFVVLAATAFGGEALLKAVGISIPAFRIAGGVLLFLIAIEMVFEKRVERKSHNAAPEHSYDPPHKIATSPLAIPLMAGPGAITATILQSNHAHGLLQLLAFVGILAVVLGSCLLVFRAASTIDRLLGMTGRMVLSRMLGVLLSALAIQIVGDGIAAFLAAHQG
jgi:multiple antibiotic resistance protein